MVVAVEEGGMGVTNRFEGVAKDGVDWSYWNEIQYQMLSSKLYTYTFCWPVSSKLYLINISKPDWSIGSDAPHWHNIYDHFLS